MRPTLIAALFLAACSPQDEEQEPRGAPADDAAGADASTEKAEPARTITGIRILQDDTRALRKDIAKIEKRLKDGEEIPAWLRRNQKRRWETLWRACEIATEKQAEKSYRHRYASLRKELGALRKQAQDDRAEAVDIRKTVEAARRGVAELPAGFTEAELLDRAARLEEEARATEQRIEKHKEKMIPYEKTLNAGGPYELEEATIFTGVVKELENLKPRIEAIQP